MAQATSKPTTNPAAFLSVAARVHLSHLFKDPFVAAAFKAAEDDGLAPSLVTIDGRGRSMKAPLSLSSRRLRPDSREKSLVDRNP
jgi:hypothetical protein